MQIGKFTIDDMKKMMKAVSLSRRAYNILISVDGPSLKFSFEDDDGKLTTVTLFDEDIKSTPTITKTERL